MTGLWDSLAAWLIATCAVIFASAVAVVALLTAACKAIRRAAARQPVLGTDAGIRLGSPTRTRRTRKDHPMTEPTPPTAQVAQPMPVPTSWQFGLLTDPTSGTKIVQVQVSHATGMTVFFVEASQAKELGRKLMEVATGLSLPPSGIVKPSSRTNGPKR